jgi:hypothetical protein
LNRFCGVSLSIFSTHSMDEVIFYLMANITWSSSVTTRCWSFSTYRSSTSDSVRPSKFADPI